jgi:hypothetical protein
MSSTDINGEKRKAKEEYEYKRRKKIKVSSLETEEAYK